MSLRQQHAVGPGGLDGAQDGAQVARVLHAVEHDHQLRRPGLLQEPIQRHHRLGGDDAHQALVRDFARHAVERLARLEAQRHAELAGQPHGHGIALPTGNGNVAPRRQPRQIGQPHLVGGQQGPVGSEGDFKLGLAADGAHRGPHGGFEHLGLVGSVGFAARWLCH